MAVRQRRTDDPGGRGSWASSPAIRRTMLGNRRRDTAPELLIRRLLHAQGLRYRVDWPLPFDQSPPRRHRLHPAESRRLH